MLTGAFNYHFLPYPEGTLWGIAGRILIALIFMIAYGYSALGLWIIVAGFIGNMANSILGASLERKGWLKHDQVNLPLIPWLWP